MCEMLTKSAGESNANAASVKPRRSAVAKQRPKFERRSRVPLGEGRGEGRARDELR
jgi:hypothetical protein